MSVELVPRPRKVVKRYSITQAIPIHMLFKNDVQESTPEGPSKHDLLGSALKKYAIKKVKNSNSNMFRFLDYVTKKNDEMDDQTIFHSSFVEAIQMSVYAKYVYTVVIKDKNILAHAFYYMRSYANALNITINSFNVFRIFAAAVTVSHKFWDDNERSMEFISRVVGVPKMELAILEAEFLRIIDWRLCEHNAIITFDAFKDIEFHLTGLTHDEICHLHNAAVRRALLEKM